MEAKSNKNYVESMKYWLTGQKQVMQGLQISVDNAVKSIEHFNSVKKLSEKQLRHESHYLETCMNGFREWCEQEGVTIPDWAK